MPVFLSNRSLCPVVYGDATGMLVRVVGTEVEEVCQVSGSFAISDAGAPLDADLTYKVGSTVLGSVPAIKHKIASPHSTLIHPLNVDLVIQTSIEDELKFTIDPRISLTEVENRRSPVIRRSPKPASPETSITFFVPDSQVLDAQELVQFPFWVRHSHDLCEFGCTAPEVMLAIVDGKPDYTIDHYGQLFSLNLRLLDPAEELARGTAMPAVTWRAAERAGLKWETLGSYIHAAQVVGGDIDL